MTDVDVHGFVQVYNFCFEGGGIYTPTDRDKAMLEDAINCYVGECEQAELDPGNAQAEPITHRWRSFGAHTWIYDPEPEWLEDHKFEVEWEPVYGAPQPPGVAQTSGWQPIETCDPAHELNVLIVDQGAVSEAYYDGESDCWFKAGKSPHDFDFVSSDALYPTLWMPLPAPPSNQGASK